MLAGLRGELLGEGVTLYPIRILDRARSLKVLPRSEQVVTALRDANRVMVLVGAGISVSCGVPDFRSENGLYSLVEQLDLPLDDPQDLFSIDAFDDDPTPL